MLRKTLFLQALLIGLLALSSLNLPYRALATTGVWTSIGLVGKTIWSLAIDPHSPTILYAGTWGEGVFRTTNSGISWSEINTGFGLINMAFYALTIDPRTPNTIYASTADGIYKTVNRGDSWSKIFDPTTVTQLAIDPQNSNILYAGTLAEGVYKSINGGGNWTKISTGLSNLQISGLVIDSHTPNTLYAGTHGGMYKSTNNGDQWTAINTGLPEKRVSALVIDSQDPSILYVGAGAEGYCTDGYVYTSTDGGENWNKVSTGLKGDLVYTLALDPYTPSILYAGTFSGVYKSTNGGGSWNAMNAGLTPPMVPVLVIDPITPSNLYADTQHNGGVFTIQQPPPTLSSNYSEGAPGSYFTFSGINFPMGRQVTIKVNGITLGMVPIDISGNFSFLLNTDQSDEGHYIVTSTVNPSASAMFVLDSREQTRPQEGSGPIFNVLSGIAYKGIVYLPLVRNRLPVR